MRRAHAPADLKYRFQWTAPILISPHDPKTDLSCGQRAVQDDQWRPDMGQDQPRPDPQRQIEAAVVRRPDHRRQHRRRGLWHHLRPGRVAQTKGLLWAGSDDGLVHVSCDGGKTWQNVTPAKMPEWGTVVCIEASHFEALSAYVVVDCHRLDDNRPYLFHTTDGGKTWKELTGSIALNILNDDLEDRATAIFRRLDANGDGRLNEDEMPEKLRRELLSRWDKNMDGFIDLKEFIAYASAQALARRAVAYLRAIREDPKKPGLLYVGTSSGVIFSTDAGKSWRPLKLNLPAVQVCDLVVKDDDLVVGTDGRSIWILDDLTPIRQFAEAAQKKELHLFAPIPAYRYRFPGVLQEGLERGNADNPPHGAILHYFLKTKPKGDVTLEIFDARDKLVRRLSSKEEDKEPAEEGDYAEPKEEKPLPVEAGLQRIVWDLRYSGAAMIKKAKTDGGNPKIGPLVNAGVYTVKLSVDGKTATAKLEVKQDPRVKLPRKC